MTWYEKAQYIVNLNGLWDIFLTSKLFNCNMRLRYFEKTAFWLLVLDCLQNPCISIGTLQWLLLNKMLGLNFPPNNLSCFSIWCQMFLHWRKKINFLPEKSIFLFFYRVILGVNSNLHGIDVLLSIRLVHFDSAFPQNFFIINGVISG